MTTPNTRLLLPEELILVALDDETGQLIDQPAIPLALDLALAGALLMELALAGRIDTDAQSLFAISPEPTGVALLDEVLAQVVAQAQPHRSDWWLLHLSANGRDYRKRLIDMLVARGILMQREKRLLWVFRQRVYPPSTGNEEREVRGRITELLQSQDIPEPHDALLVGLLASTGLMTMLISSEQEAGLRERIDQLRNLEEISRSLGNAIMNLHMALAEAAGLVH